MFMNNGDGLEQSFWLRVFFLFNQIYSFGSIFDALNINERSSEKDALNKNENTSQLKSQNLWFA